MRKIVIGLFVLGLILMMNSVTAAPSGNYYKEITIDHNCVNGSQIDFPMMINIISDENLSSKALQNGDDIIFYSDDHTTQLDHEIELYNTSTGQLVAWVRIPSLSNTANTVINMYYNNSSAINTENPSGVWGVNASGIWLMNEGTGTDVHDSSGKNNNGVNNGADWVAGGLYFYESDYVEVDGFTPDMVTTKSYTIAYGLNTTQSTLVWNARHVSISDGSDGFGVAPNESGQIFIYTSGDNTFAESATGTSINDGQPHEIVAVFDQVNDVVNIYLDGILDSQAISYMDDSSTTDANVYIGCKRNYGGNYNGTFEYVHIYDRALSAEEISTRYNNTNSPSTFSIVGAEQTQGTTPPVPTNIQNTTGNDWVNFTWIAGTGNDIVTDGYNVTINGVPDYTTEPFFNSSVGAGNWSNITVWAWNATGDGNMSATNLSDEVQAPVAPTDTTPEFVNITIDGNKSIIFANHSGSTTEGNWICLSGGDPIKLPSPFTLTYNGTNFSTSSTGNISVTVDVENNTDYVIPYPYTTYDMFTNVTGKNNVSMCFNGTTYFAENHIDAYLVNISRTSLKDAFNSIVDGNIGSFYNLLGNPYETKLDKSLDINGDMDLNFGEVDAGDYAIFILLNNSDFNNNISILSATTFQVLEYDSTTTVPSEVIRRNTFNASINLTNAPTDTYTYGAVLVHESAYYAEMQLKFNGTRAGTNLTLNGVDIIQGFEIVCVGSSGVDIMTVLDTIGAGIGEENGSVMNTTQISANNASIEFDTDGLNAGNYILLTGVYNPSLKLVAFNQSEILITERILSGYVKDLSDNPILGANILIDETIKTTTNVIGYYEILDVSDGSFTLSASKDNYVPNNITILADVVIIKQNFTLTPINASISGTITDNTTKAAIENAMVTINTTPITSVYTNALGQYTISVLVNDSTGFSVNVSAKNYANVSTVETIKIAESLTGVNLSLPQNMVTVALASGYEYVQFAENTTNATFKLNLVNYGIDALFNVSNSTTNATVVITPNTLVPTGTDVVVNVTSTQLGAYPITITVGNNSLSKSATIDLVVVMRNTTVPYNDTSSTINDNISNGSVVVDGSTVDLGAEVVNGSVFNFSVISAGNATVTDSVVMDHSTITNATIEGNSIVSSSNVTDGAIVTTSSIVEGSNITGTSTIYNATVTNVVVINSGVTGVTLSDVTLEDAIVTASDGGEAQIIAGNITTKGVEFIGVYENTLVKELVIDQVRASFNSTTPAPVDNRNSFDPYYINISASADGDVNVSVCSISPDGSFELPDVSGMHSETKLGNFVHINSTVSGTSISEVEVRIYVSTTNKAAYDNFYVAYHNTSTGKLEVLDNSSFLKDTKVGKWYAVGYTTHFSTFTLIGANEVSNDSDDNGDNGPTSGGGSGGGSSGEAYENIALKNAVQKYLSMNNPAEYTFTDELNPIRNIVFTPLINRGYVTVMVEVLKNTSTLVSTPASGLVYENMNIWVGSAGWANEQTISNAEIHFKVDKNWIKQNNVDSGDIVLVKYHGEKWTELPTTETSDDLENIYYSAKTDEFSPFAIISKTTDGVKVIVPPTKPESPDEVESTTPVPPEEDEEKPGIPGFEVIGAFGMIAAVYCMLRRKV